MNLYSSALHQRVDFRILPSSASGKLCSHGIHASISQQRKRLVRCAPLFPAFLNDLYPAGHAPLRCKSTILVDEQLLIKTTISYVTWVIIQRCTMKLLQKCLLQGCLELIQFRFCLLELSRQPCLAQRALNTKRRSL